MPRTKRPTKKAEKVLEGDTEVNLTLKKLDKLLLELHKKIDNSGQMAVRNIELAFKILTGSISKQHMSMTVGQLKSELYLKEVTNTVGRSASHDDGYMTENSSHGSGERVKKQMAPPSTSSRSVPRRSRSADASHRKPPSSRLTATANRRRSRSVYKTPAYNKNAVTAYPPITPKVAPQTPLTILRQPRQGEMVVSMTGSPVMVPTYSTMQPDEKANCNIMLADGTMLSLQPRQLRASQAYIPFSLMDEAVLTQLRTLTQNIDTVLKMGQQTLKP